MVRVSQIARNPHFISVFCDIGYDDNLFEKMNTSSFQSFQEHETESEVIVKPVRTLNGITN